MSWVNLESLQSVKNLGFTIKSNQNSPNIAKTLLGSKQKFFIHEWKFFFP